MRPTYCMSHTAYKCPAYVILGLNEIVQNFDEVDERTHGQRKRMVYTLSKEVMINPRFRDVRNFSIVITNLKHSIECDSSCKIFIFG